MLRRTRASRPQEPPSSSNVRVDDADRIYVAEGDVIANKYQVDRILGVGGVGFVVAAKHLELGGYFALKFLRRRFLEDPAIVERFTREAKAACWIQSEYSARVYDVGSHNGAPFIVMEHLVGRDLAAVLAERGALAVDEATEYVLQACAALAVAHANGIVHRDIKPENLFLVEQDGLPTIKLLDFGISKFALAENALAGEWAMEGEAITGTLICGTPFYMSPEQIRSTASVDSRSDVWSLGMVLYELLASAPAFLGEGVTDVCEAILKQEPRRLCEVRPEVPERLADVVSRCLQKDPKDRFANVADLAIALLPFAPPRALAIAERSAWIRSAAIHSLGSGGTNPRISSGYAAVTSRSQPIVRGTPLPVAPALAGPSSKSKWILFGAGAVVGASILVFVGYRQIHGDSEPTAATRATAASEKPSATQILPAPSPNGGAEERAEPLPGALTDGTRGTAPGLSARVAASAPANVPAAAPANVPAAAPAASPAPAYVFAPAGRQRFVPRPVRSAPASKTASSASGAASTPDTSATVFVVAPPVAPGSRDLGY